jgi:ribosomal protein L29
MIKITEITKKSDQELTQLIVAEQAAVAAAVIESRTKEVKGVKIQSAHKKTIARALTIARERAIAKLEASE